VSEQKEQQERRHERAQPAAPAEPAAAANAEHEAEVARLEDRFKRAAADLENYRKRSGKEIERRTTEAVDRALADWLEVADSVDRALTMQDEGPLGTGLSAVRDQIDATLERQRVSRIGQNGEPFDPDRHEAVAVRGSDDVPDRTVVEVIRSGYERDGRVLRPALVAVSRRSSGDGEAPDQPAT
jgi:molecular chaperone GrpE